MALIGIHGRIHAGKDSVGDCLCTKHDFMRLAFATPIKDALLAALAPIGVTRPMLHAAVKDMILPGAGVSARKLLTTLGTDWGRDMIDPELWIRVAAAYAKPLREIGMKIVFTDVRFENEAHWIRSQGGAVWHIRRPLADNVRALHSSEAGIAVVPGVDSVIDNDRGLEQLYDRIKDALAGECVA